MNKNLEELKKVRKDCGLNMLIPMSYLIPILEDFEKRVKKLEQAQTYFPLEYSNQTGGVDNIKIGFTNPDMDIKECN